MMGRRISRRRLLAGLGATGALGLGLGWQAMVGQARPYTTFTYAQTDGSAAQARLRVAWYEMYNGGFRAAQPGTTEADVTPNGTQVLDPASSPSYVDEPAGPAVTVGNVLPGDSGSVVVGLLVESLPEGEEGLDIWFRSTPATNLENRLTEPERLEPAEDDPGDGSSAGELGASLTARLWRDSGIAGVGACDGSYLFGEPEVATGSLDETLDAATGGLQIGTCLGPGQTECLGLEWSLPWEIGNAAQSDSVAFDLTFVGVSCGSGDPFAGTVAE